MKKVKFDFERNGQPDQLVIDVPGCWDECSDAQFPALAAVFLIDDAVMNKWQKAGAALAAIYGQAWEILEQLPDEQLYGLVEDIDWIFSKVNISINPLPRLQLGNTVMWGPAEGLKNMRFAEWCVADTLFVEYSRSQDVNLLDRMVAVLYRRKGKGPEYKRSHERYCGDPRHRFNDALLDDQQLIIAQLPKATRRAIYLWYASCRQAVINNYPLVFPKEKDPGGGSRLAADGWFGIYDDLRGDARFGGPDKLEQEFINTVFASVSRSQVKADEFRREHKL